MIRILETPRTSKKQETQSLSASIGPHRRCSFDPWVGKIPWRSKWQPTPLFLPGKSHGQRSLAGYTPWGHKELDTAEQLSMHKYTCVGPCKGDPLRAPKKTGFAITTDQNLNCFEKHKALRSEYKLMSTRIRRRDNSSEESEKDFRRGVATQSPSSKGKGL